MILELQMRAYNDSVDHIEVERGFSLAKKMLWSWTDPHKTGCYSQQLHSIINHHDERGLPLESAKKSL